MYVLAAYSEDACMSLLLGLEAGLEGQPIINTGF